MASQEISGKAHGSSGEQLRPTKVAIIHGSHISGLAISHDGIHDALATLFSPLRVAVFSLQELGGAGVSDLIASRAYDAVGVVGEIELDHAKENRHRKFPLLRDEAVPDDTVVLSFIPRSSFGIAKRYLRFSDAVILCEDRPLLQIVYLFFESLLVPSLLNIDLADVSRIAHGIGLAFNLSGDDHEKIVAKLPRECLVASSAILHFACRDDVSLREIYSISKSMVVKRPLADIDANDSEARNVIRRVNVKMGIRIRTSEYSEQAPGIETSAFKDEDRISLTAILFGF